MNKHYTVTLTSFFPITPPITSPCLSFLISPPPHYISFTPSLPLSPSLPPSLLPQVVYVWLTAPLLTSSPN